MPLIRSVVHMLWMLVTVIPWGIIMLLASLRANGTTLWWMAVRWLGWAIGGARILLGIRVRVSGMENLPDGATSPAQTPFKSDSAEAPRIGSAVQ